jgi:hypothetical protein
MILCDVSGKSITFDEGEWREDYSRDTHPGPCDPVSAVTVADYPEHSPCEGPRGSHPGRIHRAMYRVERDLYSCPECLGHVVGIAKLTDQIRINWHNGTVR